MSEKERPFTVSDRRHFTPEGQARGADAEPARPATAGGESSEPVATDAGERALGATVAEAAGPPSASATAGGPVDFSQLLLSLAAQAAGLLSGAAAAKPEERAAALDGARSVIGILEMLRDKTEGRRTPDEERLLESLLFELRMAFVERSRGRT